MNLVDFHYGWLIEIVPTAAGYQAICYSPCRQRFVSNPQASEIDAFYAAKQEIAYQLACRSLTQALQALYKAGCLHLDDWKRLQQSLTRTVKTESRPNRPRPNRQETTEEWF